MDDMAHDEATGSLADQAAAWVPPWARRPATPEPAADDGPAGPVEDGPVENGPADVGPVDGGEAGIRPTAPAAAIQDAGDGYDPMASVTDGSPAIDEVAEEPVEEPADHEPAAVVPDPFGGPTAEDLAEALDLLGDDDHVPPVSGVAVDSDVAAEVEVDDEPEPQVEIDPAAPLAVVSDADLRGALEAILLVVDEPVADIMLAQVVEQPTERVTALLAGLAAEYTATGRGFELRRIAGGWRYYTRARFAGYVEKFVLDGQQVRLTQAALETMAVVAYKQPVTRSRISAIRGVNCDGVVRTLLSRGLIEECGSEPDSGAHLYRTTTLFLEKLGLDSLDQLPALAPFLPDDLEALDDGHG
jgi:segregation and condensation protein B